MTTIRFADDGDHIAALRATWEAADAIHTEACAAFRAARAAFQRSRSKVRLDAYHAAETAADAACIAVRAADRAHGLAVRLADRRIAQAIRAARAVANGVQLQLSL